MVTTSLRRSLRELRGNAARYASVFLLVVLGLGLVVALTSAADSVLATVEHNRAGYLAEAGEFEVHVPLSDDQVTQIEDLGAVVEDQSYRDVPGPDDTTLRLFSTRQAVNLVVLSEGGRPRGPGDVVVERLYAEANHLAVGDKIQLDGHDFTIVGLGSSPDYSFTLQNASSTVNDVAHFGTAFVIPLVFSGLTANRDDMVHRYAYRLKADGATDDDVRRCVVGLGFDPKLVTNPALKADLDAAAKARAGLQDSVYRLAVGAGFAAGTQADPAAARQSVVEDQDNLLSFVADHAAYELANLISFTTADANPRMATVLDDVGTNRLIALIAGVLLLILVSYVLAIFSFATIDQDSRSIGALYALGVRRRELVAHYITLPLLVVVAGGWVGTWVGRRFSAQVNDFAQLTAYYSLPSLLPGSSSWPTAFGLLLPPLIVLAVNGFTLTRKLSAPPLKLLRRDYSDETDSGGLALSSWRFVPRFRVRQFLRETPTYVVMWVGLVLAVLLMVFAFGTQDSIQRYVENVKDDTAFTNLYLLRFPPAEPPDGGEAAILEQFRLGDDPRADITLAGISPDSNYFFFPLDTASSDEVSVSDAVAARFHVAAGDWLVLSSPTDGSAHRVRVTGVVPYASGLYVFQALDQTRELLGEPNGYFNAVFADGDLTFDPGRLASTITAHEITEGVDKTVTITWPIIATILVVAMLVFCLVLALFMRLIVERDRYSISLMKSFGYRNREVNRLYLNNYLYVVVVALAVGLPLSHWALQPAWRLIISSMDLGTPFILTWPSVLAISGVGLVAFGVLYLISTGQLRHVDTAEILKTRE